MALLQPIEQSEDTKHFMELCAVIFTCEISKINRHTREITDFKSKHHRQLYKLERQPVLKMSYS